MSTRGRPRKAFIKPKTMINVQINKEDLETINLAAEKALMPTCVWARKLLVETARQQVGGLGA